MTFSSKEANFSRFKGLCVDEIHGDSLGTDRVDTSETGDGSGRVSIVGGTGIARISPIDRFMESCEDLGSLEGRHIVEAAPDFSGGEAASCEASDHAEVVGAAFESAP
jgi:hypothetical protein